MNYFGILGFRCVVQPRLSNLLPSLTEVTNKTSPVRFHGHKSAKLWHHERYDYGYTPEESSQWRPEIQKLDGIAESSFIYTDHHWHG